MKLEILAEQFYEYLKVKGFSLSTRKCYRIHLIRFLRYLESENIGGIEAITPRVIHNYQTNLYYAKNKFDEKPLAIYTQHNALVTVKNFFEFLRSTDKIIFDPTAGLVLPKKPNSLPDVMTVEEIKKLLEAPDLTEIHGFRNRTIMEILYSTGVRNSELCGIDIYDVDFENQEVRIRHGKGNKERIVPLGEIASQFVKEYLTAVRPKLVRSEQEQALILSKTGRRMDITAVLLMIRVYVKKAGIEKRITPHTFRHTCATHLLQGGADIRYIQTILGHDSIASTQIYTRVGIMDLKEVHEKYHPREKFDDI